MDTIKMMREWADKSTIKNWLTLEDGFSIWWMMDEWLHKSIIYFSNFDDVIKGIKRKPSKKIYLLKYFHRLRYKLRRNISMTREFKKGCVLFFGSPVQKNEDNIFRPLFDKFEDKIIVDFPSDYDDKFYLRRAWDKLEVKDTILLEEFYNPEYKTQLKIAKKLYKLLKEDNYFLKASKHIWPAIKPQMDFYFNHRFEAHLRNYYSLKNMVDTLEPSIIVYGGEGGVLGNILAHIGKMYNIPVIGIMHGSLKYDGKLVHYNDGCPKATKLCVWGKYHKDWLVKYSGYNPTDITVTGNFRFDNFKKKGEMGDKILILDQNEEGDLLQIATSCLIFYGDTIVAIHPARKNRKFYEQIPIVESTEDYIDELSNSKLIVSFCSTGVLDSMFYDKPLLLVKLKDAKWDPTKLCDYYQEKIGVIYTQGKDNLYDKIRLALKDPYKKRRHEYIKSHLYKMDGKSTDRIIKVIKNEMQSMRK